MGAVGGLRGETGLRRDAQLWAGPWDQKPEDAGLPESGPGCHSYPPVLALMWVAVAAVDVCPTLHSASLVIAPRPTTAWRPNRGGGCRVEEGAAMPVSHGRGGMSRRTCQLRLDVVAHGGRRLSSHFP